MIGARDRGPCSCRGASRTAGRPGVDPGEQHPTTGCTHTPLASRPPRLAAANASRAASPARSATHRHVAARYARIDLRQLCRTIARALARRWAIPDTATLAAAEEWCAIGRGVRPSRGPPDNGHPGMNCPAHGPLGNLLRCVDTQGKENRRCAIALVPPAIMRMGRNSAVRRCLACAATALRCRTQGLNRLALAQQGIQ